jgi:hypothetical protein
MGIAAQNMGMRYRFAAARRNLASMNNYVTM